MAVPVYVNKSAFASGTGALSVGAVASVVADDLILLFVESANQAVTTPSGYTIAPSSPQSIGTAATAGGVRLSVFYRWATGADATVSVADSGNHTTAIKIAVRGVDRTTPFNANAGSTQTATTAMSFPGVTTTVADCLIVHGCAQDTDAASTATSGTPTNGNLTSLTERHDQTVTAGTGGGLVILTGVKATAGITGNTTSTGSTSVTHAYVTLALAPLPNITGDLDATETGSDTVVADGTVGDAAITGTVDATESGSDTLVSSGYPVFANTDTDSTLVGITTASLEAVTEIMEVRTGTGGVLSFSGLLSFEPAVLTNGTYATQALWRYRSLGGSWVDVGTEIPSSISAVVFGGLLDNPGELAVDAEQTGLSADTNYEVQLYIRRTSASPANTINFTGTAQVTSVTGIAGSLAATESGSDTASLGGTVLVQGSLSVSEAGSDTAALSGKVAIQGLLSANESGADSAALSGAILVQGLLSANEAGSDTLSSTGVVLVSGSLSAAETGSDTFVADGVLGSGAITGSISAEESGSDTAALSGLLLVSGSLSVSESGQDSASANGTLLIQGLLAVTETGSDSAAISGASVVTGSISAQESGEDSAASLGQVLVAGSVSASETGLDTATITGTTPSGSITGTVNAVESAPDVAAIYFVAEYDSVRGFDNIRRRKGVVKSRYVSIEASENAMFSRLLENISFKTSVFYSPSDKLTKRIGYGRPIEGQQAEEEANLKVLREAAWRNEALQGIIDSLELSNPEYELPTKMSKALYEYKVRYGT